MAANSSPCCRYFLNFDDALPMFDGFVGVQSIDVTPPSELRQEFILAVSIFCLDLSRREEQWPTRTDAHACEWNQARDAARHNHHTVHWHIFHTAALSPHLEGARRFLPLVHRDFSTVGHFQTMQ